MTLSCSRYFFLRLRIPTPMEPRPRSPRSGSGEAVCGRFAPAVWLSAVALFCALTSEPAALALLGAWLLCALMSELVELLGAAALLWLLVSAVLEVEVELLGAAALFCALMAL